MKKLMEMLKEHKLFIGIVAVGCLVVALAIVAFSPPTAVGDTGGTGDTGDIGDTKLDERVKILENNIAILTIKNNSLGDLLKLEFKYNTGIREKIKILESDIAILTIKNNSLGDLLNDLRLPWFENVKQTYP